MLIKPNTVLYASDESTESIDEAKAYINRFALTPKMVKLVKKDKQVLIIAKVGVDLCEKVTSKQSA